MNPNPQYKPVIAIITTGASCPHRRGSAGKHSCMYFHTGGTHPHPQEWEASLQITAINIMYINK